MKYYFKIIVFLLCVILSSCSEDKKYNDKYVKDAQGNVYRLQHSIGDCYFIYEVNKNDVDSLMLK